jgi:hypothetical protein
MAQTNQANLPPGWPELDEFIFHPDQYHTESVPKDLPRQSVAKFIDERMVVTTPRNPLVQMEKVVDFYDLQEVCPHLRSLPAKKEKTPEDIRRSTVTIRAIALVCLPPDLDFATNYAKYLIGRSSTLPEFKDLIGLNDALGGNRELVPLKLRMDQRLAELNKNRQGDYQAQVEYGNLEETMNNDLNSSQKANEIKAKTLAIPERSSRIREEIKMYLTIQYGYLEFLQTWATRRLRRETWGLQPAQQIELNRNPELRQNVADAFRARLPSLVPSREIPKENIPSFQVRCLRAIEYFGGKLTPSEAQFVEENAGNQVDPLSK